MNKEDKESNEYTCNCNIDRSTNILGNKIIMVIKLYVTIDNKLGFSIKSIKSITETIDIKKTYTNCFKFHKFYHINFTSSTKYCAYLPMSIILKYA